MAQKLLGNNIRPACRYCTYVHSENGNLICAKKGTVAPDSKCLRFKYNPLLRVPELPLMRDEPDAEKFIL